MAFLDQGDDRLVFFLRRPVDLVVAVDADHRAVGGDFENLQLVDVQELGRLGQRRAGHARELAVEAEVVLEGDGGERLVLGLYVDAFLGLKRLVEALRIAAALHHAAGEFVDDDDLALLYDVILVAHEQLVGAQRAVRVMDQRDVLDIVKRGVRLQQPGFLQHLLHKLVAFVVEDSRAHFLVEFEMLLGEPVDEFVDGDVEAGPVLDGARNDERRAGFVDQDRVHLVDDGEVVPLQFLRPSAELHHLLKRVLHIVAEVVEAEFVVRAVGDVATVGLAALFVVEVMQDAADGEPQKLVDLPHPFGVALGQVVVHRDDVHPAPRQRIQIGRQRCDERFALARLHLGNVAIVQDHAADKLHVEMALAERALGRLAHRREGFRQKAVQLFAIGEPLSELSRLAAKFLVAEGFELRLQGVDLRVPSRCKFLNACRWNCQKSWLQARQEKP